MSTAGRAGRVVAELVDALGADEGDRRGAGQRRKGRGSLLLGWNGRVGGDDGG